MDISIIGAGYVGVVSAACLAEKGHRVICVDKDSAKIEQICSGMAPVHEPGLQPLIERHAGSRLHATTNLKDAVNETTLTMIAVGTPSKGGDIDLSQVKAVTREIGEAVRAKADYHVVVVKSTVVPGTTDDVVGPLLEETSGKAVGADVGLGMNPEFLTEGVAVQDFMEPDRIVLGGCNAQTHELMRTLYAPFRDVPVLETDNRTAEMIKYVSNALLATLISFSNEVGNLCATLGVDVTEVMEGVHWSHYLKPKHRNGGRITAPISAFLEAGCGYGGSCLPKDVEALTAQGQSLGHSMKLLQAVTDINRKQHQQVLDRLCRHFATLSGRIITILGLAYKPGTDDMRASPALPVIHALLDKGVHVKVHDPVALGTAKTLLGDAVHYCHALREAIQESDALVLITRWDIYQQVPDLIKSLTDPPLVVDGRRVLDKTSIERYEGIGL